MHYQAGLTHFVSFLMTAGKLLYDTQTHTHTGKELNVSKRVETMGHCEYEKSGNALSGPVVPTAQRSPAGTVVRGQSRISAGAKMIRDVEVCPWEIASFKWIVRRVLGTCHQM